jgi:hypothetical protein
MQWGSQTRMLYLVLVERHAPIHIKKSAVMISLQLIRLSKNMPELVAGMFSSESGKMKI